MKAEDILKQTPKLLGKSLITQPRMCFMCFSQIPSKIAFGKTNSFRLMACDGCYKEQYKGDE